MLMNSQKFKVPFAFVVRYLTMNAKSNSYGLYNPFTLRYRRVNTTVYESINVQ